MHIVERPGGVVPSAATFAWDSGVEEFQHMGSRNTTGMGFHQIGHETAIPLGGVSRLCVLLAT